MRHTKHYSLPPSHTMSSPVRQQQERFDTVSFRYRNFNRSWWGQAVISRSCWLGKMSRSVRTTKEKKLNATYALSHSGPLPCVGLSTKLSSSASDSRSSLWSLHHTRSRASKGGGYVREIRRGREKTSIWATTMAVHESVLGQGRSSRDIYSL